MCSTSETIKAGQSLNERQVVLANLCHLVAKAFDLPAHMDGGESACLRRVAASMDQPFQASAENLARSWEEALHDRLRLDLAYARLFLGPFEVLAPPYASFYLEPDHRLLGDVSQYATQAYAAAGLVAPPGPREAPDHIVCEMEFAYFLGFQTVTTGESIWRERQRAFWADHLLAWLPHFCEAVRRAETHAFYNALADSLVLLARSLDDTLLGES